MLRTRCTSTPHQMPSCVASAGPHDPEALIAAWIAALAAATRDRCPYSRADGICSSYLHFVFQRTRRIIREVEKMSQLSSAQPVVSGPNLAVSTTLESLFINAPTGLRPPAQGCRFGYPGTSKKRNFNRNAVASFSQSEMHKADATALRLRICLFSSPG